MRNPMESDFYLDIEGSQPDRTAAYLLSALLQGVGEVERSKAITNRLQEITQAEEQGLSAPPTEGFTPGRVGMRWSISSLCEVKDIEMANKIPVLFGEVMQAHPELMFVTNPGSSVFVVSGEYLPPSQEVIE
jgi:hypothetical protein